MQTERRRHPRITPDSQFRVQCYSADFAENPLHRTNLALRCLDLCADLIRQDPDHWLWTYKRWKRRPSPEKGRYPFYSKYDGNTDGQAAMASATDASNAPALTGAPTASVPA